MPFPSEGDSTVAHVPSAGYMVPLALLAALFPGNINVGAVGNTLTLAPIIYRGFGNGPHSIIVAARANQKWATQRRRGSYGAVNALPF